MSRNNQSVSICGNAGNLRCCCDATLAAPMLSQWLVLQRYCFRAWLLLTMGVNFSAFAAFGLFNLGGLVAVFFAYVDWPMVVLEAVWAPLLGVSTWLCAKCIEALSSAPGDESAAQPLLLDQAQERQSGSIINSA